MPPEIYTNRLLLRPMRRSDFEDFLEYFTEPAVSDMLGGFFPRDREGASAVFENNLRADFTWGLVLPESGKLIGDAHFGNIIANYLAHIGYAVNKSYWGQGFATDAVSAICRFGFEEAGFGRIRAKLLAKNKPSERVLIKCGFLCEAFIPEDNLGGRIADSFTYSRTL